VVSCGVMWRGKNAVISILNGNIGTKFGAKMPK